MTIEPKGPNFNPTRRDVLKKLGALAAAPAAPAALAVPSGVVANSLEGINIEAKRRSDAFAKARTDFNTLSGKCEPKIVPEEIREKDLSVLQSVELKIGELDKILASVGSISGLVVLSPFENFSLDVPFNFGPHPNMVSGFSEKEFSEEFYKFLQTFEELSSVDPNSSEIENHELVQKVKQIFDTKIDQITKSISEITRSLEEVEDKGSEKFIGTMGKFYKLLTSETYVPKCTV